VPNSDDEDLFAAAPLPVAVLDDAQRLACLRLIRSENVGPATFRALINHFGGAREALAALPEIGRRAGRGKPVRIHPADAAEAEIEAADAAGVQLVFTIEPGYPGPLAFTEGAPPLLYVKGRIDLLNQPVIAIVGSRQASAAGIQMARLFAAKFGEAGKVVCSGLARGIDGAAHHASLESGTIAVLAGGLDIFYPPEHRELQAAIGDRGCLVSEQPLGFVPRAQDFPRRNRIISGLSRAVVVIEAARRSGTLITARLANEQGRDVFAVPGHPLDPRAEGTNQLLKDGAAIATSAEDVLAALDGVAVGPGFRAPVERTLVPRTVAASVAERTTPALPGARFGGEAVSSLSATDVVGEVQRVLGPAPVSFDEVSRATGLAARTVQVAIMELALADLVEFHGSQLVSLKRPG
jgi:DNA processing protein